MRGVGLQVHRRVDDQLAAIVVGRGFADGLAQDVEKGGQNVERLAGVPLGRAFKSLPRLISSGPSDSGLSSTRA